MTNATHPNFIYKFLSQLPKTSKMWIFPKNSLSNWFIAHVKYFFYSTHSFPTSSLPRYNIFIAPRSCSFNQCTAIAHFSHVHAAHGLIIILSHIFICAFGVFTLKHLSVYHRSLSFCSFSSSSTCRCVSMAEKIESLLTRRIFMSVYFLDDYI